MKLHFAAALILTAVSGTASASILLDGRSDGASSYGNSETVSWFNNHKTEFSIYGDSNNPLGTTTIQYGVDELAGETSGAEYFFLYVEVPLYAKNMIWQDNDWKNDYPLSNTDPNVGLTEADVASYRVHHETHHNPGDMKLDFKTATDSSNAVFVDSSGVKQFTADLAGNADSAFGLIGFKDSADYLLDNGISTMELSLARDTTMSFEFQFALDAAQNTELLNLVRNGIEFHLSPERGLTQVIPEPSSLIVWSLIGLSFAGIGRWRRRRHVA